METEVINNDAAIEQLMSDVNEQTVTTGQQTIEPGQAGQEQVKEPVQTGQEQQTQQQVTQPEFDINKINTFLEIPENKHFKSAEDFKSYYKDREGRWDMFKDLEKTRKELKEGQEALELHNKEIEELYKNANPENIFGSKDAYKNYLIKQQVTKDGELDGGIVDIILNNDLNTFDEIDLIVHSKMLNVPGLDIEQAINGLVFNDLQIKKEDLKDEEGNDLPFDEKADLYKILEPHQIEKLKRLAKDAKKELMSIKNTEVQADNNYFTSFNAKREADKQAREQRLNQLKESWSPVYDSFHDIKSVQLFETDKEGNKNVVFDFPIDSGVLSKIDKSVEDYVLLNNIEPNDENIQQVRSAFINGYAEKNWEKMVRAALTQSGQKVLEQKLNEQENRQPMNTQVNTQVEVPDIVKKNEQALREAGY